MNYKSALVPNFLHLLLNNLFSALFLVFTLHQALLIHTESVGESALLEDCKHSIYRVSLASLPRQRIDGSLLGFSVPLISSLWNVSANPVTINSTKIIIDSSMKISKNPFHLNYSIDGTHWTTLITPIIHDSTVNYLRLVEVPDQTVIIVDKQFIARYLRIVVVSLDEFLVNSSRIILCPNSTMSFGDDYQISPDNAGSQPIATSLALNTSRSSNVKQLAHAASSGNGESYSKNVKLNDEESERRAKISHPIDGRLLHYDMEEYDPEHEEALVMDRSLLSNDGLLKGKAQIKDQHGSCRHTLVLSEPEDRLEFYASNFIYRPKSIMTVHVLIKPNRTDNSEESVQTIFEVLGEKVDVVFSRICLELLPHGVIRWSHRNESDNTVFNVSTPRRSIRYGSWNQVVVSYSVSHGLIGESRIIVNGSEEALGSGHGFISKDWDRYSAIGKDHYGNHFVGQIDEFVVFDRLLHPDEIDTMFKKCDYKKYFSGGKVWAKKGAILSPHYPKLYKGAVESSWFINGVPGEIIEVFIDELQIGASEESPSPDESKSYRSCDRSSLLVKEKSGGVILGSYCDSIHQKTLRSSNNQIYILFASSGEPAGIKFRIEFTRVGSHDRDAKRNWIERHPSSVCRSEKTSYMHRMNMEKLVFLKKTSLPSYDLDSCISSACEGKIFDWAVMEHDQCYGVYCEDPRNNITFNCTYDDNLPVSVPSEDPKNVVVKLNLNEFRTLETHQTGTAGVKKKSAGRRERPGDFHSADDEDDSDSDHSPLHYFSRKKKKTQCEFSPIMENLVLASGKDAGAFEFYGETSDIVSCQEVVCASNDDFDVIIWWRGRCFSVKCNSTRTCSMRPGFTFQMKKLRNIFLISYRLTMWQQITQESLVGSGSFLHHVSECEANFWPSSSFAVKNIRIVPKSIASGLKFTILTIDQSLETCQSLCCNKQTECDAIFMSESLCYMISCDERNPISSASSIDRLPATATGQIISPEENKCVLIGEKNYMNRNTAGDGTNSFSNILIPTAKYIQEQSGILQCKISRISLNSRLKYGLNSGKFVDLGRADGISLCAQMACQADAGVALLLDDLCFGVACHTDDSCQDVSIVSNNDEAGSSSHSGLRIASTIAYIGDTGMSDSNVSRDSGFGARFENTFKIRKSTGHQLLMGKRVGVIEDCTYGEIFQAITMKYSEKDGRIFIGSRKNIIECGVECCALDWCRMAYLQGSNCYASRCEEPGSCVVRMLHNENALSTVMYLQRHGPQKLDGLQLSREDARSKKVCRPQMHGLVVHNVMLRNDQGHNLKMNLLGLTSDLQECMKKCCVSENPCDTVYLVGLSCYGLVCGPEMDDGKEGPSHFISSSGATTASLENEQQYSDDSRCTFEPNSSVQSVLAMQFYSNARKHARPVNRFESWLIYIICGGILGISAIIGLLLVLSMYLKRRRLKQLYKEYQLVE